MLPVVKMIQVMVVRVEGALCVGLGLKFDVSSHITLISDNRLGLALPDGGLKLSGNNFGLCYFF